MECNPDVRDNVGRSTRNGLDSHADPVAGFAGIEVDVLAVSVDGFAGVDGEPLGAAVEIGFQGEGKVRSTRYDGGESELGGVGVDFEGVVKGCKWGGFVILN